ncbi:MAG: ribosomal protein S18-alanine N-acetyltransferase [Ruminococcus sp.]|nr:ribosomal protein S18-alanine N-acetyltransferase [Ruminococcus sp.]
MEIIRVGSDLSADIFEAMSALDKSCFGGYGWSAKAFLDTAEREGGVVLAAFCDDVFAGLFAGFTAGDTGEVLTIATVPEQRRKGIARTLLAEFLSLVPDGVETVALEVRQSNAAAIALYESFGFVKEGVRRRFYRDPVEDADIMVKSLR